MSTKYRIVKTWDVATDRELYILEECGQRSGYYFVTVYQDYDLSAVEAKAESYKKASVREIIKEWEV